MITKLSSGAHAAFIQFSQQGICASQVEGLGSRLSSFFLHYDDFEKHLFEIAGILGQCNLRAMAIERRGPTLSLIVESKA